MNESRRRLLRGSAAAALAGWPFVRVLGADRVHHLGIMINDGPEESASLRKAIERFLEERGFAVGKNLRIDYVYSGEAGSDPSAGSRDLIRLRARQLVALKPDAIYVDTSERARALVAETKTIPVIFSVGADPVASGLVRDLTRPGGNVTGSSRFIGELLHKRIELTRELLPGAKRAALVADYPQMASLNPAFPEEYEATGDRIGLALARSDTARYGNDLQAALESILPWRPDAVLPVAPFFGPPQAPFRILAAFERKHRIPVIGDIPGNGALALGADWTESVRAALNIVIQVFKGANPATIPINRATRIVMTVNRSAARAIGLSIPQSILLRADRVAD